MTYPIFPFAILQKPRPSEVPVYSTDVAKANEGHTIRRSEFGDSIDEYKLRAAFAIRVPQASTGKTLVDWLDFVHSLRGARLPFLFAPILQYYREIRSQAVGTGDGSTKVFRLPFRYLKASTLVVYVDGVAAAPQPTLSGNSLDELANPIVTFTAAPGNTKPVTMDVDVYYLMYFEADGVELEQETGKTLDVQRACTISRIVCEETKPAGRLNP